MFEQEIELEKRQSATVPLLLIVALIVAVVGVAMYYVIESRKVLGTAEAANLAISLLNAQGPATVTFQAGLVKEQFNEGPRDARYRLLEKLGIVKLGKSKGPKTPVALTPKGTELLKQITGVKQSKDTEGNETYIVPLAARRLVDVSGVTMTGTGRATVEYTWQWEPNALGEGFDASGDGVGSFNTWDRATLIDKYGVRFYHDAPARVAIAVVKTSQGWQVATE